MGENKRYGAANVNQWLEGWILREEPMLLTPIEIDLEGHPPTDFPEPRKCKVWIRYPSKAVLVDAQAYAWNNRAVRIRFLEPTIKTEREGWVWTNAVIPESRA